MLNNGVRARDVSSFGADHSMDVDLFNVEQIEIVKGPASLLYTNGAIGGIVNVVDDTIASEDFSESESVLGMETQSVNNGQVEFVCVLAPHVVRVVPVLRLHVAPAVGGDQLVQVILAREGVRPVVVLVT